MKKKIHTKKKLNNILKKSSVKRCEKDEHVMECYDCVTQHAVNLFLEPSTKRA